MTRERRLALASAVLLLAIDFNEGMLPFEELLNIAKYPDGPQLCYRKGTDVCESQPRR